MIYNLIFIPFCIAGGKIDVATTDGMTALLYAASRSHLRIVEFFLDKGADIDHISIEGNTVSV